MNTSVEAIDRLVNHLREKHAPLDRFEAADMLLALKARAEAAEKDLATETQMRKDQDRRLEAAEQSRAKFMEQLRIMSGLAETAQARAEAAEKREAALREVLEKIADAPLYFGDDHGWIMDEARAALEDKP